MPKKIILIIFVATIFITTGLGCKPKIVPIETLQKNISKPMQLTSPSFKNGEYLPLTYSCDGKGTNPTLKIADVPTGTKDLVLIVDDPDAPSGDFVHWTLWNIDPAATEITENTIPNGATVGLTSAGNNRYVPPCPPTGIHHYTFKLYALDIKMDLPPITPKDQLLQKMNDHIITQTELVALYSR